MPVGLPPTGTVTLLFTDIEGSTRLWDEFPATMRVALERHDALVRSTVEAAGGYVFKTVGDSFCVAFGAATDAVGAAVKAQRALASTEWPEPVVIRVRMGLHTGECAERGGDYFGSTVNRAARLEGLAHGGQIVVSGATAAVLGGELPEGVGLRAMGEHRLRDLGTPEHVFQVDVDGLAQEFAPLRSLSNPALPNNLPQFLSVLVGRGVELVQVRDLLDAHRLVTLTGSGGAGKTRLALQVAADLLDGSGDGVWLVDLAAIGDPDRVAAAVASVLSIREDATLSMLDVLTEALADRAVLLVLDNCEHVIDAAAKLADRLLNACPAVELLATSREPLGVDGERVYRVPSLAVPEPDATVEDVAAADGTRLFVERARMQVPDFAVTAETANLVGAVVRRLDGIPLALELAAARLRSMSVAEVSERLDQRFRLLTTGARTAVARQQTLRGAIDWSYSLLNDAERIALCRSSVFVGGFDLAAAEAILADSSTVEEREVVDLVDRLVDKSLIQYEPSAAATSRYRLLESVRDYAAEHLVVATPNAVDDLRRLHLAHFADVAITAEPQLNGPDQVDWQERLASDHGNLLSALRTAVAFPDVSVFGLRLASALTRYWLLSDDTADLIEILRILCDRDVPDADRAAGLATLAIACVRSGQAKAALVVADAALFHARRADRPSLVATALTRRATVAYWLGDAHAALADATRALAIVALGDDHVLHAAALEERAYALMNDGDLDAARADFLREVELSRSIGDTYGEAKALNSLGDLEIMAGNLDAAAGHLATALHLARHWQALAMDVELNLGLAAARGGLWTDARAHYLSVLRTAVRRHENHSLAVCLTGYARSIVDVDPPCAAAIQAASDSLMTRNGIPLESNEARLAAETRSYLGTHLAASELEAAEERGRSLTPSELVAFAEATNRPT